MKILILGDGVIGSVYGHELSVAGFDVTHLIRKERADAVRNAGISMRILDGRGGKEEERSYLYKPTVINELSAEQEYDFFIISAKANRLESTLRNFSERISANTTVVIFQSLWSDAGDVSEWLNTDKIIYGFPHVMGGGKDDDGIYCTIFGSKDAPTMLGTADGKNTAELETLVNAVKLANMNPLISHDIVGWIYTHYAEAAGLLAGVMQADDYINFALDKTIVRKTLYAIREGLNIWLNPERISMH